VRVLNAYAGIGGNRHLWPADWHVTAVEHDPRVAAEYSRRYPTDVVLVEDAHAVVMERSAEFDAVWSSPPCPTHGRLAGRRAMRSAAPTTPDPRLMAEVQHLMLSGRPFVVENVHLYYRPAIAPSLVTGRHSYWVSDAPVLLTETPRGVLTAHASMSELAAVYGLPELRRGAVPDARTAMRNAVHPVEGLELALAAFAPLSAVVAA
jgi:DNA (cytosine-5)-methyltransferase 1